MWGISQRREECNRVDASWKPTIFAFGEEAETIAMLIR
jgi:hypothetical protein